jgi:hypothetical protein
MFKAWIILFLLSVYLTCEATGKSNLNKSPRGFIQNKGQVIDQNNKPNPAVLYLMNTQGMNVQLRMGGFSYDLYRISNIEQRMLNNEVAPDPSTVTRHASRVTPSTTDTSSVIINFHRIDLVLKRENLQLDDLRMTNDFTI